LDKNVQLGKAWRAANKKYEAADKDGQARLRFERSWIYNLVIDFCRNIYDSVSSQSSPMLRYCERMIELLSDLLSQLPTRRYVRTLLVEIDLLPIINLSNIHSDEENILFRDSVDLLRHYLYFPIDDVSGREHSTKEQESQRNALLGSLQKVALSDFKDKLTLLALSNHGSLSSRDDLSSHFEGLTDDELLKLCQLLTSRTEYPSPSSIFKNRSISLETLLTMYEKQDLYRDVIRKARILPTEVQLNLPVFARTEQYSGSEPLALPKLNLQYLSINDFLWRSFILYRTESFSEVKKHIEDLTRKLQPRQLADSIRFEGFSKMAMPISKPAIVNVTPPLVGKDFPAAVQAEIDLDISRFTPEVRREWESQRPGDVLYLVNVQASQEKVTLTKGGKEQQWPIKHLRCAEIVHVMDEEGRPLRDAQIQQSNGYKPARKRKLLVKLDAMAYQADISNKENVYDTLNLLIRRRGRENNFKPVLDAIRQLVLSDSPAPTWLQDVFLGYSDPAAATYKRMPNKLNKLDYRDTFLNWSHLVESVEQEIDHDQSVKDDTPPPYTLEHITSQVIDSRPLKKRKREKDEELKAETVEKIKVSTYQTLNKGPFLTGNNACKNKIRFTSKQVEAITSGMQPGLTVVVGPPGTGKTDVATQIINNIYHNHPEQKTLIIAHSNQALNQLFQKIIALDIDQRHLLRLGHGEGELETDTNYSKYGRIEALMERSVSYLTEVTRLANSIDAPGAHGNSCETAGYFEQVYIKPAWIKFWDLVGSTTDTTLIINAFPFYVYFSNAPQPLFPSKVTLDQLKDIATGCQYHLDHIFTTLAETRPFEILRSQKDKANYLLSHSARIIAMTSTHAAMNLVDISSLNFDFQNLIMEESAQITEIESFIPICLSPDSSTSLQRVILIGDHNQNAPIILNPALRSFSSLDSSLFSRLIRLGVPTITLNAQARARPSIASLYSWRYPTLTSLPVVSSGNEFIQANAGFRYTYQFIDVQQYKGRGESNPSSHFVQNLGEAEYAVALYQYMRLLGYRSSSITILTPYAGQKALIRDVLSHRCKGNRLFGLPKVSTVDRYQGEQNDYVILSLVRTERVGYMRDLRRLTVALSRARLGLYVLGKRELWENSLDTSVAFEKLLSGNSVDGGDKTDDRLAVVTGEMHPTKRREDDQVEAERVTRLEGVEHLGQYVYEMTKLKMEDVRNNGGHVENLEDTVKTGGDSDDDDQEEDAVPQDEVGNEEDMV